MTTLKLLGYTCCKQCMEFIYLLLLLLFVCQLFHKMIDTQFDSKIIILRSDNGGKYMPSAFSSYLLQHCILHQTTCLSTTKQNGITKTKNHHLLEITRALLFTIHVPKFSRPILFKIQHISWIICHLEFLCSNSLTSFFILPKCFFFCLQKSLIVIVMCIFISRIDPSWIPSDGVYLCLCIMRIFMSWGIWVYISLCLVYKSKSTYINTYTSVWDNILIRFFSLKNISFSTSLFSSHSSSTLLSSSSFKHKRINQTT